jgi:hypothetical protein
MAWEAGRTIEMEPPGVALAGMKHKDGCNGKIALDCSVTRLARSSVGWHFPMERWK